jgi:hypothetical protein
MGRVGAHLSTKNRLALLTNATVAYKEFNFFILRFLGDIA